MERMIPTSFPKIIDKSFKRFANMSLLIFQKFQKHINLSEYVSFIKKFIGKILTLNQWQKVYG
jgi:hypothetical protein